ncbi:MAG: response regulator [Acidobacteriota bacterium]
MARNRILVAEDDASILRLLTAILRRAGYEVDTATNGRDAIERIERTPYDAIVLDLMMPGSSGFDVLAHLKFSDPQHKFVIIMSAASPHIVANAVSANVFAALHKPFEIDDLTAAVKACIDAGALTVSASGRTRATVASERSGIAAVARR